MRGSVEIVEKTFVTKKEDVQRDWYVVDATGQTLGRLAARVARVLRGKHKPTYSPAVDTGDYVIIVNAGKVHVTGRKLDAKRYYRHSGYPGGIKSVTLRNLLQQHPTRAVKYAVKGMLPKNRLGRRMFKKLKVYAGPDHPHAAQQPKPLELN
jgi:large subunit ribosomal protein L13